MTYHISTTEAYRPSSMTAAFFKKGVLSEVDVSSEGVACCEAGIMRGRVPAGCGVALMGTEKTCSYSYSGFRQLIGELGLPPPSFIHIHLIITMI